MPTIGSHRTSHSEQKAAMFVIEEHRRNAFKSCFGGTTLTKTSESIKSDAKGLYSEAKDFAEAVVDAAGGSLPGLPSTDALDAVLKVVGIEKGEVEDFNLIMAEELAVLTGKSLLNIAQTFTPYLSTVLAGKDMVKEWVQTAIKGHRSYTLKKSIPTDILPGDPQAAAGAVRQLITRSASNHARLATINTPKFSGDVAASAGGGAGGAIVGPATAAAAAGAKLANTLFLLGRDYHEMKGANTLLKSGVLPTPEQLFGAYPLLGCYMIAGADDSDLLFFFIKDMGAPGWMDKVEQQKKRTLGPLQQTARKTINGARFELAGFHGGKVKVIVAKKTSRVAHLKSFASRVFG